MKENVPWIEKYNPKDISDIVGNEDVINRLKKIIKYGNMQNMIIVGTTGTGKTSSINCLTKALIGMKYYRDAVLELNASEDRGINTVRTKIKMFAQKKVILPKGVYKIIVLDEADSMTSGAQQALRRTIEIYSYNTRFVFICNQISQIIEPIQSRCCIFKFSKLTELDIKKILYKIISNEKIEYDENGVNAILLTSHGDLRQAINNLQSTYCGYHNITYENVLKICDIPQPDLLKSIIEFILVNDFRGGFKEIKKIHSLGYSPIDIVNTLFEILKVYDLDEIIKMKMIKEIAFTNIRIINGVDSTLQLGGLVARLCYISKTLKQ